MAETHAVETDAPEIVDPPGVRGPAFYLAKYIETRDKRRALKRLFETEDAPFKDLETNLGLWLQRYMMDAGIDQIKAKDIGVTFLTTKFTASLKDPDEFMKYVVANNRFDLMDRKANTTAVRDFLKKEGALPPGANLNAIQTIGVHKKVGGKLVDD